MKINVDNIEKMQSYLTRALQALHDIEYEMEEGTFTDAEANFILETQENLEYLFSNLETKILEDDKED